MHGENLKLMVYLKKHC